MGREVGTPPVMVAELAHCDDCGKEHSFEKCPKCGSWISIGYGLMGGGFGLYKFCNNEACDWMWKRLEDNDDE